MALGDAWATRLRVIAPTARITVIPNAVRPRRRVTQPAPGEPVHVVFLGRIGDHKGAFRLLDAWAELARDPDFDAGRRKVATLTIAGDGEVERARRRIRELRLEDTVELREWLSESDVGELLDRAQVLVLPSRNEGQPMAVLEAMARGLCIIASDVGGLPEMIGGGCGVIVPPDDIEAIAAALRLVVDDRESARPIRCRRLRTSRGAVRRPRRLAPNRRTLSRGVQMRVRPIRVLFVVPNLFFGGAERNLTTLLPRMDPARFTPSVICIGEEGYAGDPGFFPTLPAAGIEAVALRLHKRQAVRALIELVMMMRRTRPDVVVVQGYNAEVLGRIAARIAGVKHTINWVHNAGGLVQRGTVRRTVDRALTRWTSAYFGVAEAQRPYLVDELGHPDDKIRIIYNGVDLAKFRTSTDRGVRAEFGFAEDDPVVGIVARLRPEKDHVTLATGRAHRGR